LSDDGVARVHGLFPSQLLRVSSSLNGIRRLVRGGRAMGNELCLLPRQRLALRPHSVSPDFIHVLDRSVQPIFLSPFSALTFSFPLESALLSGMRVQLSLDPRVF